MKNLVYTGIIAVCLVVAIVVFVMSRGGGGPEISDTEVTWVKCLKCGESYEMPLKQYYEDVQAKSLANPTPMPMTPPLTCEKCAKEGIVKAVKCDKCGEVFREGTVPNDFPDRCPKCKHSATEARREANKAARGQ
jgi:predicted Zn-ribbon and HTH transcriptional regulator